MSGTPHVEPTTFTAAWGGVTLCIVMSAVLNGSITMQTYSYFHKFFHKDRLLLKYAIGIIWLGSTFHFVCEYWIMHDIIVVGYHLPFDEVTIPIGFSIALAVQSIVHCLVQGVYISRMFRFSHNIWVLVSCCVLVALELGLGLAWGGRVAHTAIARQANAWNEESRWMITTFFTVSMVVDVIITASMCYQLMRSRTMGLKRFALFYVIPSST
ncbi:hypothetical protein BD779DRAFT_927655 [Infundibulicybe gibba]|nr:hypothetical protein BD779DRAFT_927655 [Infundibulicybe gibba]